MGSKIRGWDLGVNQARAPQFHGIQRRSESESADLRSVPFSLQICSYLTFIFFVVICKYQDWNIQNYSIRDLKCQLILCLFVRAWSTSIFDISNLLTYKVWRKTALVSISANTSDSDYEFTSSPNESKLMCWICSYVSWEGGEFNASFILFCQIIFCLFID